MQDTIKLQQLLHFYCSLMVISVVLHTLSGTIPHSCRIPPYHLRIQASNLSRITQSPYRGKMTGNVGLVLSWKWCHHFILDSHIAASPSTESLQCDMLLL